MHVTSSLLKGMVLTTFLGYLWISFLYEYTWLPEKVHFKSASNINVLLSSQLLAVQNFLPFIIASKVVLIAHTTCL